jgi:hypothetical protein
MTQTTHPERALRMFESQSTLTPNLIAPSPAPGVVLPAVPAAASGSATGHEQGRAQTGHEQEQAQYRDNDRTVFHHVASTTMRAARLETLASHTPLAALTRLETPLNAVALFVTGATRETVARGLYIRGELCALSGRWRTCGSTRVCSRSAT